MPKLKTGNIIRCRVKSAVIVGPYESYDEIKTFAIVATDKHGYYLFIPNYFSLKGSIVADQSRCKTLNIDKRFLNEEIMVASVERTLDGLACKICREFFFYAEANQEDGTLICFSCRQNPYH